MVLKTSVVIGTVEDSLFASCDHMSTYNDKSALRREMIITPRLGISDIPGSSSSRQLFDIQEFNY